MLVAPIRHPAGEPAPDARPDRPGPLIVATPSKHGPRARAGAGTRLAGSARRLWAHPAGRFLVRYPVFTALVFVLPPLVPGCEPWLIEATLRSLSLARFVTSAAVDVAGTTFRIGETIVQIVPDCTSLFPTLLLLGGILAFPASWRVKLAGAALGIATLWLYNLVRIYVLMGVLRWAPAHFDLVHVYLWQSVTLLVVLGCFVTWTRFALPRRSMA
jgi:exosortase/archaeosortase family protein